MKLKGHNYGLCRKCGETHIHPQGMKGKTHTAEIKLRMSNYKGENAGHWKGGKKLDWWLKDEDETFSDKAIKSLSDRSWDMEIGFLW